VTYPLASGAQALSSACVCLGWSQVVAVGSDVKLPGLVPGKFVVFQKYAMAEVGAGGEYRAACP
jgi:hypothetical protein